MSISKNNPNLFGILLFAAVFVQVGCVFINIFGVTDSINHVMYTNNYFIGFLILLCLASKGISEHFLAISFFGCFMLFLMAQKPFEPEYNAFLTFARLRLTTSQYFVFSVILFSGLAVTFCSYLYFSKKTKDPIQFQLFDGNMRNDIMRPVLTAIWAVTLPCALYMQVKIVMVRGGMEYTSGYLVNVSVPGIIKAGYYIYSMVILLCLAVKPSKKTLVIMLGSYFFIEGGLQMFQGRRALFASTLFFVVWYLLKYYNVQKISLKNIVRVLGLLFGVVLLFYVVEQVRDSSEVGISFQFVRKFLVSTGGSDSVIANTIARKDSFPVSGFVFLLNPLVNNTLGNFVLGKASVAQGAAYLQQHYSFPHWISYMTEPSLYLSGHGMGSCYLAEMYLALGMFGVLIVSVFLGWAINKLNRIRLGDNLLKTGFVFFVVRRLFTLPRDGMFSWTSSLLYLVFVYALVYPFYAKDYRAGVVD